MRYFIDTEFDGFGGPLISMALVREDGRSMYFEIEGAADAARDPWVIANVLPIIRDCPEPPFTLSRVAAAGAIQNLLQDDPDPLVIADWPDDLRHLCDLVVYGPGEMIGIPSLRMEVRRVDAYPTTLKGAVQHNAWWDAVALLTKIDASENETLPPDPEWPQPGAVVRLRSSGTPMTVTERVTPFAEEFPSVRLAWFTEAGEMHEAELPIAALARH